MNITRLCVAALLAPAYASAQTTSTHLVLPSTKEYFELAAEAQLCNGGEPVKLQELDALRNQALDYYRTKQSKEGFDSASAGVVRELEANVLPTEALEWAASMRRIAADWGKWCRAIPSLASYDLARHDLAMATIGWPGAKPLDQARAAVAAFYARGPRVDLMPLPPPPGPSMPIPQPSQPARIDVNDPSCHPVYPPAAIRTEAQGVTRLQISVDAQGHVVSTLVLRSAGGTPQHALLDEAARSALVRCPFEPGIDAAGNPVGSRIVVDYTWKLD